MSWVRIWSFHCGSEICPILEAIFDDFSIPSGEEDVDGSYKVGIISKFTWNQGDVGKGVIEFCDPALFYERIHCQAIVRERDQSAVKLSISDSAEKRWITGPEESR